MPQPNPEAFAFLASRHSHPAKMFKGPVPSRDQLLPILTAALRVPDHGKIEPWRLIVVDRTSMTRLADLAEARAREMGGDAEKIGKGRGQYDMGQLAVAVISSPQPHPKVPPAEQIASADALCMNLVNSAEAAGWGANWLTGWPAHDATFAARAFGCTASESIAGIVHIGTPPADDWPDSPRPDVSRIVTWTLP